MDVRRAHVPQHLGTTEGNQTATASRLTSKARFSTGSRPSPLDRQVVRDGMVWIGSALYSSSISLSAARSGGWRDLLGSGALDVTLRSMAIR
jgi:hypothetical protein